MRTGRVSIGRASALTSRLFTRCGVLASAVVLASAAALSAGCASGGGGGHSAPEDAGTAPRDGSAQPRDAGATTADDSGTTSPHDGGTTTPSDAGTSPPDAGPTCSESPCRLVGPQCGCPVAQACYVDNTGTRGCARAGSAGEGQACGEGETCQAGHLCVGDGGNSFCSRFCDTDADCSGEAICLFTLNDGAGGSVPGVKLCTNVCNPASSTGCPSGMGCGFYGEPDGLMREFTACRPAGTRATYQSCTTSDDCTPGHFCADVGGSHECIRFCTAPGGVGAECGTFEDCHAFDPPVTINGGPLGYCL